MTNRVVIDIGAISRVRALELGLGSLQGSTIEIGGLLTRTGANLGEGITLSVPKATPEQFIAFNGTAALTADVVKPFIDLKADKATTISAAGLATGGGALGSPITITVPKANAFDFVAYDDTKALTSFIVKAETDLKLNRSAKATGTEAIDGVDIEKWIGPYALKQALNAKIVQVAASTNPDLVAIQAQINDRMEADFGNAVFDATGATGAAKGDLSNGFYTPDGTGAIKQFAPAVLKRLDQSLERWYYDEDAGDWAPALTRACAYLQTQGGGQLKLYSNRTYACLTNPTLPTNPRFLIRGLNAGSTSLRFSGSQDGLTFSFDDYLKTGGGLAEIAIEGGAGIEGFQGQGSTGQGVSIVRGSDSFILENVAITGFGDLLELAGCFHVGMPNIFLRNTSGDAIRFIKGPGGEIGAGNRMPYGKLSNFGFTGSATASRGIHFRASGGDEIGELDVTGFGIGCLADPRAAETEQVLYVKLSGTQFDTSVEQGIVLDGTEAPVWTTRMTGGWSAFNGGDNVLIKGANTRNTRITGTELRQAVGHGLRVEGGTGLLVGSSSLYDNDRDASGTKDHISIAAGVSDWSVQGCKFGSDTGAGSGRYCVHIAAGATTNAAIVGNNFTGGHTASIPVFNGATGLVEMSGNVPKGLGANVGPYEEREVTFDMINNDTIYLGAGSDFHATAIEAVVVSSTETWFHGFRFAVNNIAGVGQTITLTLVVDGVDTAMVATLTGDASFEVKTVGIDPVYIPLFSEYYIRIDCTAGAGTPYFRGFYLISRSDLWSWLL